MPCKIDPCSFISLYLDQYQNKIFLKNDIRVKFALGVMQNSRERATRSTRLAPLTVIDDPDCSTRRPARLFSHCACARRWLRAQQSFFFCQTFPALICFEARLKTRILISQTSVEDKAAAYQPRVHMQSNSLRFLISASDTFRSPNGRLI